MGSIFELCYIQSCVITNHVIKRLKCIFSWNKKNMFWLEKAPSYLGLWDYLWQIFFLLFFVSISDNLVYAEIRVGSITESYCPWSSGHLLLVKKLPLADIFPLVLRFHHNQWIPSQYSDPNIPYLNHHICLSMKNVVLPSEKIQQYKNTQSLL